MHEWTSEPRNQWINDWMSEWLGESTSHSRWFSVTDSVNPWITESRNKWTNESVNTWIHESMLRLSSRTHNFLWPLSPTYNWETFHLFSVRIRLLFSPLQFPLRCMQRRPRALERGQQALHSQLILQPLPGQHWLGSGLISAWGCPCALGDICYPLFTPVARTNASSTLDYKTYLTAWGQPLSQHQKIWLTLTDLNLFTTISEFPKKTGYAVNLYVDLGRPGPRGNKVWSWSPSCRSMRWWVQSDDFVDRSRPILTVWKQDWRANSATLEHWSNIAAHKTRLLNFWGLRGEPRTLDRDRWKSKFLYTEVPLISATFSFEQPLIWATSALAAFQLAFVEPNSSLRAAVAAISHIAQEYMVKNYRLPLVQLLRCVKQPPLQSHLPGASQHHYAAAVPICCVTASFSCKPGYSRKATPNRPNFRAAMTPGTSALLRECSFFWGWNGALATVSRCCPARFLSR